MFILALPQYPCCDYHRKTAWEVTRYNHKSHYIIEKVTNLFFTSETGQLFNINYSSEMLFKTKCSLKGGYGNELIKL